MRFLKPLFIFAAVASLASCSGSGDSEEVPASDSVTTHPYDLLVYELHGHPRKVERTTYFDVKPDGNGGYSPVDSTIRETSTIRFTPGGEYRAKEHERILRDDQNRIIRWENRRPVAGAPVALSKDTIEMRYIDRNHLVTDGMGQYAVLVYDGRGRVSGQYTVPRLNRVNTAAFNIYTAEDDLGNWTERVTVWSTQSLSDSLPTLHYTIDRRKISYYKFK